MRQLKLFKDIKTEHGGSLAQGQRNTWRPLPKSESLHLVLKSHGKVSFYEHLEYVEKLLKRQAQLAGVKLYDFCVHHNHIHHCIQFRSRDQYKRFVRAVTGILARKFGRGLWTLRPYTKAVSWGRQYENLRAYIWRNRFEARALSLNKMPSKLVNS